MEPSGIFSIYISRKTASRTTVRVCELEFPTSRNRFVRIMIISYATVLVQVCTNW